MANDKTIKTFTAIDIEKYHTGQLSAREMHDLEKASLDDPFLADALEGYTTGGVNAVADITDLKKRLEGRLEKEKDKTNPLAAPQLSSFRWWKAAAMIILVAGAGFLVYQLAFRNTQAPLAKLEQNSSEKTDTAVATPAIKPDSIAGALKIDSNSFLAYNMHAGKTTNTITYKISSQLFSDTSGKVADSVRRKDSDGDGVLDNTSSGYADITLEKREESKEKKPAPVQVAPDAAAPSTFRANAYAKTIPDKKSSGVVYYDYDKDSVATFGRQQQYNGNGFITLGNSKSNKFQHDQQRRNIFRGVVMDNNNNALPFANITNIADNVGTYTDARGNFVLTSTDSVLNVQVKSIGFDNNVTQLQNKALGNQVIMQEDHNSLSEVVISHKKINSARSRTSNMVLEEPEPVDGWDNYDTYVANNLNVPESYKTKQTGGTGEVELSFDVNKNGEAVNITVQKSLCESCDKEAIRIIKEGPKWKRKAKKKRMTVTISF